MRPFVNVAPSESALEHIDIAPGIDRYTSWGAELHRARDARAPGCEQLTGGRELLDKPGAPVCDVDVALHIDCYSAGLKELPWPIAWRS